MIDAHGGHRSSAVCAWFDGPHGVGGELAEFLSHGGTVELLPAALADDQRQPGLQRAFHKLESEIDQQVRQAKLAA